jgi:hypothetical protein
VKTYEDAMAQGHTAILLSEQFEASDIFQMQLGNLPAKN